MDPSGDRQRTACYKRDTYTSVCHSSTPPFWLSGCCSESIFLLMTYDLLAALRTQGFQRFTNSYFSIRPKSRMKVLQAPISTDMSAIVLHLQSCPNNKATSWSRVLHLRQYLSARYILTARLRKCSGIRSIIQQMTGRSFLMVLRKSPKSAGLGDA